MSNPICDICGASKRKRTGASGRHQCSPRTLKVIDGKHRMATLEPEPDVRERADYGDRLEDGFGWEREWIGDENDWEPWELEDGFHIVTQHE